MSVTTSIPLTVNGVTYNFPWQGNTTLWGSVVASWAQALTVGVLQKSGGAFTLTADANFGATYGLVSTYFKSRTANIASAGAVRLAHTDVVDWRNTANDGNLALGVNSSDHLLFESKDLTPLTTDGDIAYQDSGTPVRLGIGVDNQVLAVVSGAPAWTSVSGTGDVQGPASSVDNHIARFNGTSGKAIQSSSCLIDDAGNLSTSGGLDCGDYLGIGGRVISDLEPETSDTYSLGSASRKWQKIYGTTIYGALDRVTNFGATAWTPTGSHDNCTYTGAWRRVGDVGQYRVNIAYTGAPSAANLTVNLPAGHVIDTPKLIGAANSAPVGSIVFTNTGGGLKYSGSVIYSSTGAVAAMDQFITAHTGTVYTKIEPADENSPVNLANTDTINLYFEVPIVAFA